MNKTGQDGGPSSPHDEIENSLQFLSDEYDDMQKFNTAINQELSRLGKELSNLSVRIEEISVAVEALQQYSYQYNVKIVGFPQVSESESSEDTANLCLRLFSCLGVNDISLHDIDIAHRVPGRARAADNKPKPIICKFVRRLAKEKLMAARRMTGQIRPSDLGLPDNITFERIGIYDHLTPKLQELLHSANNFKTQHGYKFCWARNAAIFLRKTETSRPIRLTKMDDLLKLAPQGQIAADHSNE